MGLTGAHLRGGGRARGPRCGPGSRRTGSRRHGVLAWRRLRRRRHGLLAPGAGQVAVLRRRLLQILERQLAGRLLFVLRIGPRRGERPPAGATRLPPGLYEGLAGIAWASQHVRSRLVPDPARSDDGRAFDVHGRPAAAVLGRWFRTAAGERATR